MEIMSKTNNPSLCLQKIIKHQDIFMVLALQIALRFTARPERLRLKQEK